eukprot:CAMPEP_0185037884 /NCGR_PEP_ID=MMETSP1103-20130426/32887_1 /TAXON_ID=36769 /ORGANISM="Paraphysomonas bandaiensis, Strain Caron Lab Isolate" /LENGTH=556 /DNA_ID=CAMNT_0027576069 /DNA_START=29 /DNA_END=1699 /DNA_ORIENTATION=+
MGLGDDPLPYGVVNFKTSCADTVEEDFNTAVSMMYSFWYSESLIMFDDIISRDPKCCMAYWGAAMTYNHPVWDFIEDDRLEAAGEYSSKATSCATTSSITDRELGYIESLAVYMNTSDPTITDPAKRLQKYADAVNWKVYQPYDPIDENAGVIYGLAMIGVGYYSETEPEDGFPNLMLAGLTEELIVRRNKESPGALHYVIHSYDQPGYAFRALDAAYKYCNVSVKVPHALHMPSHIFSDLGLWDDMITANTRSMNSAYSTASEPTGDWYHASYFLEFGSLQRAMDCDAFNLVLTMQELSVSQPQGFSAEAAVRVPTMYYVETRDWETAADFDLSKFYSVPAEMWENNPWTEITANFIATAARAILNFPAEDITASRQAVDDANTALLSDPDWTIHQLPYWRLSFNVMVESARAWETFRVKSADDGIEAMEAVRELQVKSWAPEVAHAWDANEQLAEMFLLRGREGDIESALAAYEKAISIYPNRYRSLAGAAKCADMLKNDIKASRYYGDLITLTSGPFPDMSLTGFESGTCSDYSPLRRPELADAYDYFSLSNK